MTPRFMLDTNICIHIRRARPPQVLERFRSLKPGEVVMSPITLGELLFGVKKIRDTPRFVEASRALAELAQLIPTAPFDASTAGQHALFRAKLQRAGQIIGNNDLWIAAHAAALDVTLVTDNTREFDRLKPDLRVEYWATGVASSAV